MIKNYLLLSIVLICVGCKSHENVTASPASTAQSNVTVLDRHFKMEGLDRSRQIRVYLPISYKSSQQKYPVVYMHDGQNLFDDSTAYAGEWGVDESLNKLSESSDLNLIVVGIDNGQEKRMSEMSPWENKEFGKPEGDEYVDFIVKQIKPFVDSTYRTMHDRENTAIMGSSMGGLISHYALYKYPNIFGKAGIFSASYWYSDAVYDYTLDAPVPDETKLFMVVGLKEGYQMVHGSKKMYNTIIESGHPKENVMFSTEILGDHQEASWREQFVTAIQWLFLKKEKK